jgi:hypothetical protein
MNAPAGRGDEGITREILIGRVAMMNVGEVVAMEAGDMVKGKAGGQQVHMRLVGLGDKQVLVVEPQRAAGAQGDGVNSDGSDEVWRTFRRMIDRLDGPVDEARSMVMFGKVMRRLSEQQDTELRWRWVRRVATALAAAAGAGAVRMLSR